MDRKDIDLCEIAIAALRAVSRNVTNDRHKQLWQLAIRRIDQTRADVQADEEIAAARRGIKHAPTPLKCDCQNPDGEGVRHASMECPVHNDNPWPSQG